MPDLVTGEGLYDSPPSEVYNELPGDDGNATKSFRLQTIAYGLSTSTHYGFTR